MSPILSHVAKHISHRNGRYTLKKDLISIKRKEEICATLKQMMKRKSIQKITIQDLADECGISRYTFYYHFTDIYDCLSWLLQHEVKQHIQSIEYCRTWEEGFDEIFRFIQANASLCKQLRSSPYPDLLYQLFHRELAPLIRLSLSKMIQARQYQASETYMNFLVSFCSHGLEGLLAVCYQFNQTISIETLRNCFLTVLSGHLDLVLEQAAKMGLCHEKDTPPPPSTNIQPEAAWNCLL